MLFFGVGFGIGFFGGYGWGWHHWGFDWHHHYAEFDHARYYSRSRTFYNRNEYYRGVGERGGFNSNRSGDHARASVANRSPSERGGEANRPGTEPRSFSGYDRGGQERNFSSR